MLRFASGLVIAITLILYFWYANSGALRRIDPKRHVPIGLEPGSNIRGMATITSTSDGVAALERIGAERRGKKARLFVEEATLQLPKNAVDQVLDALARTGVLQL